MTRKESTKKISQKTLDPSKAATTKGDKSPRVRRYWLVKSEPDVFGIDDLAKSKKQTTCWDGVRNYQARNTLRDDMQVGDMVLFYHSNADPCGITGIASVVRAGYPDHTAFDPNDIHYDPKSDKSNPTWYMVDIQLVTRFARILSLAKLKQVAALKGMILLRRGSRLSVQPVGADEFRTITTLGGVKDFQNW